MQRIRAVQHCIVATEIHASAIKKKKKLKKLNCYFIVPFDRFPATFVAPELFVTVALSSHCCRVCVCVSASVCVYVHIAVPVWMWVIRHISLCLPSLLGSAQTFSPIPLNIHRNRERTIREGRPHKYNQPSGSLLISAYMHLQMCIRTHAHTHVYVILAQTACSLPCVFRGKLSAVLVYRWRSSSHVFVLIAGFSV